MEEENQTPQLATLSSTSIMPKHYCDYCDVFLTHDSASVRKAHNSGRNHLANVKDYYASLGHDKAQSIIDQITSAYESSGGPPAGGFGFGPQHLGAPPPAFPGQMPPPMAPGAPRPPFPPGQGFPMMPPPPGMGPPGFPGGPPPFPPNLPPGARPPFPPNTPPGGPGAGPNNAGPPPSGPGNFGPPPNNFSPPPPNTFGPPPGNFNSPPPGPGSGPSIHPDRLKMMGNQR
ncbi:zf-U1-domain-containing protein [Marasmius fiardii PR-910]|nr:zf-U1-domain-containing protein [Marasmius fiardii PR-910]